MGNFTDKDMGWKKTMNQFTVNAGEASGFVGWLRSGPQHTSKGKAAKGTPITMAGLAALIEHGGEHMPEYAPVRQALAKNAKDIKRLIKKVTAAIVDGKMTKRKALGIVCQKVTDGIVATIDSNLPPPNSEETIRRKGSDHTLIDTAQYRNAVDWEVTEDK